MTQAVIDAIDALNTAVLLERNTWQFLDLGITHGVSVEGSLIALQKFIIANPGDALSVGINDEYIAGINARIARNNSLANLLSIDGGYQQAAKDYYTLFGA